jgi:hypothetical protein
VDHWQSISHSLWQERAATGSQHQGEMVFTKGAAIYAGFLYLISMFLATFCNVAFYHEIRAALKGDAVSLNRGFRFALSKLGAVLMWTLFAGLIGFIIRVIEQRVALVGKIIAAILGLGWSIAAVFVIPVLVTEEGNPNPFGVLKKSATTLKQTWGEALIGYAGLGIVNAVVGLGLLLFLMSSVAMAAALQNIWIGVIAGVNWLVAMIIWSYLASIAGHVYRGALYIYATEGVVPQPYDRELLDSAWKFRTD